MIKIRGYVSSRDFMGNNIPQQVQNMAIRDYCLKNGLEYHLSEVEYSMKKSYFAINGLLQDNQGMKGIVFYSLFQLPEEDELRINLLKKSLNKKIILYFTIENMTLKKIDDIDEIDQLVKLRKIFRDPNLFWPYAINE